MTKSEYQELVEFIGEDNRHQIRVVAEGVSGADGKLEAFRSEVAVGFQDLRELLRTSHLHPLPNGVSR